MQFLGRLNVQDQHATVESNLWFYFSSRIHGSHATKIRIWGNQSRNQDSNIWGNQSRLQVMPVKIFNRSERPRAAKVHKIHKLPSAAGVSFPARAFPQITHALPTDPIKSNRQEQMIQARACVNPMVKQTLAVVSASATATGFRTYPGGG